MKLKGSAFCIIISASDLLHTKIEKIHATTPKDREYGTESWLWPERHTRALSSNLGANEAYACTRTRSIVMGFALLLCMPSNASNVSHTLVLQLPISEHYENRNNRKVRRDVKVAQEALAHSTYTCM